MPTAVGHDMKVLARSTQAAASTETLRSEARALMASVSEFAHHDAAAA